MERPNKEEIKKLLARIERLTVNGPEILHPLSEPEKQAFDYLSDHGYVSSHKISCFTTHGKEGRIVSFYPFVVFEITATGHDYYAKLRYRQLSAFYAVVSGAIFLFAALAAIATFFFSAKTTDF